MLTVVQDETTTNAAGGGSLLDELAREGARKMLATALQAEATAFTPDLTAGSGMAGMAMTHYMELLAVRQPWN